MFGKNAGQLTLREKLVSMVYSLDLAIGEILDTVRDKGLEENTLILFYSDNGGLPGGNESYNAPLRGQKGDLWDGGIRVPFCMQWKGQIPAGLSYDFVVSGLDLLPTVVNLAGGSFAPEEIIDGNDLLPAVTGQTGTPPNDIVLWWHNGRWVARDNEWKLVDMGGGPELYHIIDDISEATDVYAENQAVVSRLQNYCNTVVGEFDLVTDASRWSSNATYYMDIRDPAYAVIYEPTNISQWLEATYPGTDTDNDGLSNHTEFMHGLPIDAPSELTNGILWNLDSIAASNRLDVTFNKRVTPVGENAIPAPTYAIEQADTLTNAWHAASTVLTDGPNPTGDPNYMQETREVAALADQGFYRVGIGE